MAKRKPFNWSVLDRSSLYSMLYKVAPLLVGRKLEIDVIHSILAKHIKAHIPVKVARIKGFVADAGLIYMGGTYYSDNDQNGRRQVEVVFSYHLLDEFLTITDYRFKRLCGLFADTILHEIVHMRQYRARNFKDIPGYESTAYYHKQRVDQEYYGHRDEMGAFAFNIACELTDRFAGDTGAIFEYMNSSIPKKHKRTSFYRYLNAFDWDHNHKIIVRLKKLVLNQLDNAILGKPFKTQNHLTY